MGAHRAVASARDVVSVTQTALLISTRQWRLCHEGPKMAARQKISPAALPSGRTQLKWEQLFTQNDENNCHWGWGGLDTLS